MRCFFGLFVSGCVGAWPSDDPGTASPSDPSVSDTDTATPSPELAPAFILVMDNSESMREEATSLADAFEGAVFPEGSLVGVTTTDGEGALVGDVITTDYANALREQLLCHATCFAGGPDGVPSDPGYACGDPWVGLSVEALDCLCPSGWVDHCGAANEQGLEAAYRASLDPVLVPAGYQARIVVVSDEGDGSALLETGDPSVGTYDQLLGDTVFDAIVPGLDATGAVTCAGIATDWGVQRYQTMTELTGGELVPIFDASCGPIDVGAAFEGLVAAAR